MTPEQAQRCFHSSEEVFTADGYAVTIGALYQEEDDPVSLAMVQPGEHWVPIKDLTAREDLSG
jgi:hypothetical protein